VQFFSRHALTAVWKTVLEHTQVVFVLRKFKGHKSVDCRVVRARRENALRVTSLVGLGSLQATGGAGGQALGRRADCEQEESSENAKGIEEHRGKAG